jgi:hypothetical protein
MRTLSVHETPEHAPSSRSEPRQKGNPGAPRPGLRPAALIVAVAALAIGFRMLGGTSFLMAVVIIAAAINIPAGVLTLASFAWTRLRRPAGTPIDLKTRFMASALLVIAILFVWRIGALRYDSARIVRGVVATDSPVNDPISTKHGSQITLHARAR